MWYILDQRVNVLQCSASVLIISNFSLDITFCLIVLFSSNRARVFFSLWCVWCEISFSVLNFAIAMRSERLKETRSWWGVVLLPCYMSIKLWEGPDMVQWLILFNIICFHLSNIFDVQFLQWVKPFKCNYNSTLVIGGLLF